MHHEDGRQHPLQGSLSCFFPVRVVNSWILAEYTVQTFVALPQLQQANGYQQNSFMCCLQEDLGQAQAGLGWAGLRSLPPFPASCFPEEDDSAWAGQAGSCVSTKANQHRVPENQGASPCQHSIVAQKHLLIQATSTMGISRGTVSRVSDNHSILLSHHSAKSQNLEHMATFYFLASFGFTVHNLLRHYKFCSYA